MNYAELSMAISDWLNKDSIDNVIPTIIRFGQKDLEDNLRIRAMEYHPTTASVNAGTAYLALPADYLEMIFLQLIKGGVIYPITVRSSPLVHYATFRFPAETGVPDSVTRIVDDLYFDVLTDVAYSRDWMYFRRLPVLTASTSGTPPPNSNWWSVNAEEAFLMSCLNKASMYITGIQESDKKKWKEAAKDTREALRLNDAKERMSGAVHRTQPYNL